MSSNPNQPLPSNKQLVKATALAVAVAGVLLVTTVLPAEYGIDPTGVGSHLGLNVLASEAAAAEPEAKPAVAAVAAVAAATPSADQQACNMEAAAKAAKAFGANDKQRFAAEAFSPVTRMPAHETLTVTLAPGKGAEVKTLLKAGEGMVFHWKASGDVAIDMHGERIGEKGGWTSYDIEAAQREAGGTFVAPFEGSHGWYWENRGTTPVTVQVDVTGFQEALYQP